jgi:hypothetical protein
LFKNNILQIKVERARDALNSVRPASAQRAGGSRPNTVRLAKPPFGLSKLFVRRPKGGNEKQGMGDIVVELRSDKDRLSTGAVEPAP